MTDKNDLEALLDQCARERTPVILYGPPGTGKTREVERLKARLIQEKSLGLTASVQFHKKFSYEDFIEGFRPDGTGFSRKNGIFKQFCEDSSPETGLVDLFVIDEINRADIASTFGEALFALEDRENRKVQTAHFGETFSIPESVFIVGTMNTADKGIAHIDFAIRRRFQFVPLFPTVDNLRTWIGSIAHEALPFTTDDYLAFFERTNLRIRTSAQLGSHMQLGEALFMPPAKGKFNARTLHLNFVNCLLPQVESYLGFGNISELGRVFNPEIANSFVQWRWVDEELFIGIVRESVNDKSTG